MKSGLQFVLEGNRHSLKAVLDIVKFGLQFVLVGDGNASEVALDVQKSDLQFVFVGNRDSSKVGLDIVRLACAGFLARNRCSLRVCWTSRSWRAVDPRTKAYQPAASRCPVSPSSARAPLVRSAFACSAACSSAD